MTNYNTVEEMLGNTTNMRKVIDNQGRDDDTLEYIGPSWFSFNEKQASKIYVSGNSWIGIGTAEEDLKVCRRDAKLYNLYMEEARITYKHKVFKIRWEGYSVYNSTSKSTALKYEWFFFETGDMLLNIIEFPTTSIGKTCIGSSQELAVDCNYISYYSEDKSIKKELIKTIKPLLIKYLIESNGSYYTVVNDELKLIDEEVTSSSFIEYGMDMIPSSQYLVPLANPAVLCWVEKSVEVGLIAKVKAYPPPQILYSRDYVLTDVLGVRNIEVDCSEDVLIAISIDGGETWRAQVKDSWLEVSENEGMSNTVLGEVDMSEFEITQYMLRFIIAKEGYVKKVLVHYINEEDE